MTTKNTVVTADTILQQLVQDVADPSIPNAQVATKTARAAQEYFESKVTRPGTPGVKTDTTKVGTTGEQVPVTDQKGTKTA